MFSQIEERRSRAGIEQRLLCQRAGVHETTYTARKNGRRTLSEKTINKLADALDALLAERGVVLTDLSEAAE